MRGAVLQGLEQPIEVRDDVEVAGPGPGEVRIRVIASGVCHSDVSVQDGTLPNQVAEGAHKPSSERVAYRQIARVATEPFAKGAVADQREAQRRDRGAEDRAGKSVQYFRQGDRQQGRP